VSSDGYEPDSRLKSSAHGLSFSDLSDVDEEDVPTIRKKPSRATILEDPAVIENRKRAVALEEILVEFGLKLETRLKEYMDKLEDKAGKVEVCSIGIV
jgi:hypothetical protein